MKIKKWWPYLSPLLFILLGVIIIFSLFYGAWQSEEYPVAQNGQLDLTSWDGKGCFPLAGKWEFYWQDFLAVNDFKAGAGPDLFIPVPSVWNNARLNGQHLPGEGYATYHLHVTGAIPGRELAMRISPPSTAYRLYVDDELEAFCGEAGTSESSSCPQYKVQSVTFTPEGSSFDIIFQVANFTYARGGIWYTLYMGDPAGVDFLTKVVSGRDFFLLGTFFVIIMFCLYGYTLRHKKELLFFSLLCLMMFFRTALHGDYTINTLMPSMGFFAIVKVDYAILYWIPYICLRTINLVYPKQITPRVWQLGLAYAIMMSLTLFLPVYIMTQLAFLAEVTVLLTGIYGAWRVYQVIKEGNREAFYVLLGIVILVLCTIRDALFQNNIIKTGFMDYSPLGFFLLVLLWGCVFILRYDHAQKEWVNTLSQLCLSNEQTRDMELKFLRSQIRPHFINNALNTIISVSRNDIDRARTLLVEFSKYLRGCYDFNFADLENTVPLVNELSSVRAYLAIEKERFRDRLRVTYDLDDTSLSVPPLVLQPLVENAVIHGIRPQSEGGSILIYVKISEHEAKIGVKDDGVGLAPEEFNEIIYKGSQGVALGNINQRLQKIYNTSLHIASPACGGTDIYFIIPLGGD